MCQEDADSDCDGDCDIDDVDDALFFWLWLWWILSVMYIYSSVTYDLLLDPQINELHLCTTPSNNQIICERTNGSELSKQ